VLNILGFDGFVAFFASRAAERAILRVWRAATTAMGRATAFIRGFSAKLAQNPAIICVRISTAA
jgi:hypothetical protein